MIDAPRDPTALSTDVEWTDSVRRDTQQSAETAGSAGIDAPAAEADEWGDSLFVEGKSQTKPQVIPEPKVIRTAQHPAPAEDDWEASTFQESQPAVGGRFAPRTRDEFRRPPNLDAPKRFDAMPTNARPIISFEETPRRGGAFYQSQAPSDSRATFSGDMKLRDVSNIAKAQPAGDDWDSETFKEGRAPPSREARQDSFMPMPRAPMRQDRQVMFSDAQPARNERQGSFDDRPRSYQERQSMYRSKPIDERQGMTQGWEAAERPQNTYQNRQQSYRQAPQPQFDTVRSVPHSVAEDWGIDQSREPSSRRPMPQQPDMRSQRMPPPPRRMDSTDGDMATRFDLPPFARDFRGAQDLHAPQQTLPPPGFKPEETRRPPPPAPQIIDMLKNTHGDGDFYEEDLPMDPAHLQINSHFRSDMTWENIGIPAELMAVVRQQRYEYPSKIQAQGISLLLKDQYANAVVQAPTGSGKTLTFVLSTLAQIDRSSPMPQVICVAPTIELLTQLTQEYTKYAQAVGVSVAYVRRGNEYVRCQVLLMTPSQASFVFQIRSAELQDLRFFVIDEADHLLNKEDQQDFATNMSIVIKQLPPTCRILLFSATYSESMRRDFNDWLERGFVEIGMPPEELVLDNIRMYYVKRSPRQTKLDILMALLGKEVTGVTVVFVNTIKFAQVMAGIIERRGYKSAILVGKCMTVNERTLTLEDFKKGFYKVLVATNLLARGIDNTHISRVVNFDIPVHWGSRLVDSETYLHRVGRTGRFTRAGEAITIVASDAELKMVEDLMLHYGCQIESLEVD